MQTAIRNRRFKIGLLLFFSLMVLAVAPSIGIKTIGPSALFGNEGGIESDIFWNLRMPRVLASFIVGGALAAGGLVFQTMFHNPLATPFTLGVSSGASLGAVLYIRFGLLPLFGAMGVSVASFLGALSAILAVYGLTRIRQNFSTHTMLLAGVAMSFFFSSVILFVQYLSDFTSSFRIVRWLMGGLSTVGYDGLLKMLPFVIIGIVALIVYMNELNLISTGDDVALSRGVDVRRVRKRLFLSVSLMIGGIVAVAGPIGFVGMMVPLMVKMMVGPDHRVAAPVSIIFGGAFLTLCDAFARVFIAPAEIPVGVITALLGGPFFMWLLISRSSSRVLS